MNGDDSTGASVDNSSVVIIDANCSAGTQRNAKLYQNPIENSRKGIRGATKAAAKRRSNEVLPDPSPEQRDIIRAVSKGQCVVIRACAGSGKTTCMLQVAASLPEWRKALIVTYNRSLADECKERIQRLSLGHRIKCYTIHGLASRFAGRVCNDDHKLMRQVDCWGKGHDTNPSRSMPLDMVMIDEAQDLRPLFHRTLSHIFDIAGGRGLQLCLVGDPKQMLYDFPTYGEDKASTSFFLEPRTHWGKFSQERIWTHLTLSVSYRLTPNIASFCNLFWGTSMVGGNTASPNVPVEYLMKYPYPDTRGGDDPNKLPTSVLSKIIDRHGPENVMFLAQSVKRDDVPIRVHINELMKIKDPATGLQKYNFHIKENIRGFEGKPDWKNKVRVWTFCGSKGCEADVVVVFGFDIYARPHALNQIGVALSRARKRLLVIHGKKYENKQCLLLPFYPVLGDCPSCMEQHIVRYGRDNSKEMNLRVPAIGPPSGSVSNTPQDFDIRCKITRKALAMFAKNGVITVNGGSRFTESEMRELSRFTQKESKQVYVASEFSYFSALAEKRFLSYGTWTKPSSGDANRGEFYFVSDGLSTQVHRIEYETNVRFATTTEDVSALYGEAVVYMLHWELCKYVPNIETNVRFATTTEDVSALYGEAVVYMLHWELCKYVPNIETVVSDGILRLHPQLKYDEEVIRRLLRNMSCEELSPEDDAALTKAFVSKDRKINGKNLIPFINNILSITKKKKKGDTFIVFPVKAIESKHADDDDQLTEFLPRIKSLYESETSTKKPYHWIYLANAVMAFSNYHEKFRQIGTDPNSYESWVDSEALTFGLERLRYLMKSVSTSLCHGKKNDESPFEKELLIQFAEEDCITEPNNRRKIVGVGGVCDWINEKQTRNVKMGKEEGMQDIDLLEIKFVHNLSNIHRLQVLVYTALYALKVNNIKPHTSGDIGQNIDTANGPKLSSYKDEDYEWEIESCRGMLYNARTGEMEFCTIEARRAMDFLLNISQFKFNGMDREDLPKNQAGALIKKEANMQDKYVANCSESSLHHHRKPPKRRLIKNTGKSYYTPLCIDDDGGIEIDASAPTVIDDTDSTMTYRSKKRQKKSPNRTQGDGTDQDPIVLD